MRVLQEYLGQSIEDSVQRHGFTVSRGTREYLCNVLEKFVQSNNLFTNYDFHGEQIRGLK